MDPHGYRTDASYGAERIAKRLMFKVARRIPASNAVSGA
jgi:hypothetical protein